MTALRTDSNTKDIFVPVYIGNKETLPNGSNSERNEDHNMKKTLKVGIVGCGWFGNYHLDNLLKMEGVEVAALAASNPERLAQTARKVPGAATFTSGAQMLREAQLDAAVLCVTPARHEGLEVLAAQRGIHLYVEKPIGLCMQEVEDTLRAIESAGIIAAAGYQGRYSPAMQEARQFLQGRKIGLVRGEWVGNMPGTPWWRVKDASGGQIVEQCTHIFDILRYLVGEMQAVSCQGLTGLLTGVENYSVEDCSSTTIRFENGAVGNILTACYLDTGKAPGHIGFSIYAQDAQVECEWGKEIRLISGDTTKILRLDGQDHARAMSAFLQAVRQQDPSLVLSSYTDAAKTLKATLGANQIMQTQTL